MLLNWRMKNKIKQKNQVEIRKCMKVLCFNFFFFFHVCDVVVVVFFFGRKFMYLFDNCCRAYEFKCVCLCVIVLVFAIFVCSCSFQFKIDDN